MSTDKHEYRTSGDDAMECDSCGYPGKLSLYPRTRTERDRTGEDLWLCEVCSNTYLSVARKHPSQCSDPLLYQSIARLGNMLLEAIRGEAHPTEGT